MIKVLPLPIRTSALRSRQIELGIELAAMLPADLTTPKLLGLMGYLNNLVGCLLIRYGAAHKDSGQYLLDRHRVNTLASLAAGGGLSITVPITYTHQYLKQYWPGATNHRPFLGEMRSLLAGLKLISYDPQQPGKGQICGYKNPPTEYYRVDFVSLIALYDLLEQRFLAREKPEPNEYGVRETYTLADLPLHRGALMREIFNLLFAAAYGRVDAPEPDSQMCIPEVELEFFDRYRPTSSWLEVSFYLDG